MDQFDSEDEGKGRPGVPVDVGRLLQALRRHWRVIPTAVAAGALIGLAVAMLLIKPTYTAKTTLLWEPPSDAEPSDRSFLTQVDSIKLTSNIQEVKRRLRSKATVDELKEKINLLFDGQSHLVVIEATDGSAKGAVLFANTVADVFLAYQRSIGSDRGSEHVKRIDADIAASTSALKTARDAYDVFRAELQVLSDFDTELKLAVAKVAEFKQQLVLSGTDVDTEAARISKLNQEAARQPTTRVSAATLTNPDAVQLATLKSQLATERAHLSSDHPTVLRLQQQVEALEQKVRSNPSDGMVKGATSVTTNETYVGIVNALSASKVAQEAAAARRENYRKLLAEAELRLAKLSAAQGRAQQLLSAISSEEAHKAQLETLRVQNLDQARSSAADFRVVNRAAAPDKPNASKRRAMVIRMPAIALALAVFGIVAYELRGLRVHTAREAGFWANAAVIASSTWPREQTTLGALIDELSDAAPAVRGTTLVVGARVNEVPLAREIAYWLSHLTTGMTQRSVVGADEPVVGPGSLGSMAPGSMRPQHEMAAGGGSALARRGNDAITVAQAWDGPPHGPSLRRASRLADRVLVVVAAGTMSVTEVAQLRSRLGRSSGIGVLLVGLNPDFVKLPDRVGEVERFWEERAA
ncbi:MAG TPA: Wzz/FepE/Etk N-terminal domain-containing protein [Polyangiales bacterium]|nr:Wzz/FepE/Etk N-terminal domain-containing protein [Polyangiales bacterium]